jgi:NitT/TauT family transport system ATP-binding protein
MTPSGTTYTALKDLSLQVAPGEFCAVVGPTGCGKSTTLTLVSGLERPSEGTVKVHGADVSGITPGVAFMFQTDAVLPWKTVLDNVALGPRFRGTARSEAKTKARDWLRRVGLACFEDRFPHQLSGGMRKRVALAQSLINEPRILLMDEPFSALDVQTRAIMSNELLQLWDQVPDAGELFIMHDLEKRRPGRRSSSSPRAPVALSRRVSRLTYRVLGWCRRFASSGVSSICTTRSGTRCARKWMSPTPKPPQ